MNIMQLISSYGFFGAENVVIQLSKELSLMNVHNYIGVFNNSQNPHVEVAERAKENELNYHIFDCRGKFDIKTILSIKKFIKKHDINILHTHGYKSNIYGYLGGIGRNVKLLSTCHNWIAEDKKTQFYYKLDKLILKRFNRVIAVSNDIYNVLTEIGVQDDKKHKICNGININQFKNSLGKRTEFNLTDNDIVIGTVGRLSKEKGFTYLIKAARRLCDLFPNVYFLVIGDGPQKNELIKLVNELQLKSKIIFTGQRNDIPDLYSIMDLFVLPSIVEALPMVILEAMASKVPVIASRVGEIPNVIKDKSSGLLVDPGNSDSLYETINLLLKNQRLAESLTEKAFNAVSEEYSSWSMAQKYLEIYEELIH